MRSGTVALVGAAVLLPGPLARSTEGEVASAEARAWKPAVRAAKNYARTRAGTISFTVEDIAGRHHAHHGGRSFQMLSTYKVMLMVAYLRRPGVRTRALTGDERALLGPMIRRSNNDAASTLHARLGRKPLDRLAERAGMRSFRWSASWPSSTTTSNDQARFMRTVEHRVPVRHRGYALELLRTIVEQQRWGIAGLAPPGWVLHFKGGWSRFRDVDHQVAQLRSGSRRIGIAIFTAGQPSREYGKQTLRGVARRLLRELPA